MPPEWIDLLAVAGEPDECVEQMKELLGAGAAQVSLVVASPDEMEAQLTWASKEILPAL